MIVNFPYCSPIADKVRQFLECILISIAIMSIEIVSVDEKAFVTEMLVVWSLVFEPIANFMLKFIAHCASKLVIAESESSQLFR